MRPICGVGALWLGVRVSARSRHVIRGVVVSVDVNMARIAMPIATTTAGVGCLVVVGVIMRVVLGGSWVVRTN